jgi:hypothetical protein
LPSAEAPAAEVPTGDAPAGPSKSELKKRAKEAEKAKKAAEKAAKQAELAAQKESAEVVRNQDFNLASVIHSHPATIRTLRPLSMASFL